MNTMLAGSGSRYRVWKSAGLAILILESLLSTAQAQEAAGPRIKHNISPGASPAYTPDRWSDIRVGVINRTDEELHLLSSTYIEPQANLQFGRRLWVPPQASINLNHPIRIPQQTPEKQSMTLRSLLSHEGGNESTLIQQQNEVLQGDLFIRVDDRERWAGLLDDDPYGKTTRVTTVDLMSTARFPMGLGRTPAYLVDRVLPHRRESYDAFDQIAISSHVAESDVIGMAAIRAWLFGGGRLWVMLDRVDPIVLEHLLGEEFECEIVDRVGLNEYVIKPGVPNLPNDPEPYQIEVPADLVRVVQNGFEVMYSINGWPAAMWKRCGHGELLVTTLSSDGWVRPRTDDDPKPPGPVSDYVGRAPLTGIAARFFQPRPEPSPPINVAEEYVRGYIGYSIPSRGMILGVLIGFTALIGMIGLVLDRMGRLEYLGIVAPVIGVIAGGVLIQAGYRARSAVSDKTAVVQFVHPLGGTDSAGVTATAGIFQPSEGESQIVGHHGGWSLPDVAGHEQTARRLIWTDLDSWQWENLRSTPSVRFTQAYSTAPTPEPLEANTTLNEQGFIGHFTLPEKLHPGDGILIGPAGRMSVTFHEDGSWSSGDTLRAEEFLSASVLSDEQNRRIATLKNLLGNKQVSGQPSLLFWTEPWDMGIEYSETAPIEGSALVTIPVTIHPAKPGTSVKIPAPWLPYRETRGPDGTLPAGFYNNRQRNWSDKAVPSATWIRFQMPERLDPLSLQLGKLVVRVNGPVGKLTVSQYIDGQIVPIQSWTDPIGTLTHEFDASQLPRDSSHGVFLHVAGGDPDRPELTQSDDLNLSYWKIESLELELRGVIPETGAAVATR